MSVHRPRRLGRSPWPLPETPRHYLLLAATASALLFTLTVCWKALRDDGCAQGRCTQLPSASSSSRHGRRSGLSREAHAGGRPFRQPPALMSKVPPDMRPRCSKAAFAVAVSAQMCMTPYRPASCCSAQCASQVALLFLVRGAMHHEAIWRSWFEGAGGLVPKSTAFAQCSDPASKDCAYLLEQAGSKHSNVLSRQHLFSVHVHAGPDFKGYPRGHVFSKTLLDISVKVRQPVLLMTVAVQQGVLSCIGWPSPAQEAGSCATSCHSCRSGGGAQWHRCCPAAPCGCSCKPSQSALPDSL